jgi:hypothetical protein
MGLNYYLGEWYCNLHQERVSYDGVCDLCLDAQIEDHIDAREEEWWYNTMPEGGFTFGDYDEK